MPIANPEQYHAMLDAAKAGNYAYPAINITSSETANAALRGFADAGSDGIIQISTGGGKFASGTYVGDMAYGAIGLADFVRHMAARYDVLVALHTDHCQPDKVDTFLRPIIDESKRRLSQGKPAVFNSHMFDGSAISLPDNLDISARLLEELAPLDIILEVEAGVVGGEEDGVSAAASGDHLYTSPEDVMSVVEKLGTGEQGRYLLAATFGNVHGAYKPGNVQLKPEILRECQETLAEVVPGASFDYVFHGGSGSLLSEIHDAVDYGVVKMNVDTDNQYAFTRAIADHMFKNYDGVLKVDGEVGDKKTYDPRVYLATAETSMAERVVRSCEDLRSAGRSIS